uniref:Uncharacterized protein n=1 Tax=Setaria viridis TaxID=4556 RepID=A0A4U6TII7_SETVI|nr:hypothetical protein SEVIR_8G105050v2 [Setaria viridis]
MASGTLGFRALPALPQAAHMGKNKGRSRVRVGTRRRFAGPRTPPPWNAWELAESGGAMVERSEAPSLTRKSSEGT